MDMRRFLRGRLGGVAYEQDLKAFCPTCGPLVRVKVRQYMMSSRAMLFCLTCRARATRRPPKKKV